MKQSLIKIVLASAALMSGASAFAENKTVSGNHVYGSATYNRYEVNGVTLNGGGVTVGDRIAIKDNQALRVEGEYAQTGKSNGIKLTIYDVKANYEYAIPAGKDFYLIPNGGVGFREMKVKGADESKLRTTYAEVGVRGQTQVGEYTVMPHISYTKDLSAKANGFKVKKGDSVKVGVQSARELDADYALTFGVSHEQYKNDGALLDKFSTTKVGVGVDF